MDFEKVQEYFEDIVKRFPPFKDSRFFQALINYLKDYYLKDQYDKNPQIMKSLYEENKLVDSVYDQFLASLGVYDQVIKNLNINEKQIFLNSLSDFFKYKSSIDFFQKVAQFFPDRFDVYELFIDYDSVNSKWVLKPFEIYRDPISGGFEENLDYETVYNTVPSLLVSTEQLTTYYNNEDIILPLKSNLILLSYSFVNELDDLNNLAISTFLKEQGAELVPVYFKDKSFNVTINNIYKFWYYLVWKLNSNSNPWGNSSIKSALHFDQMSNPYTLENIDQFFNDINSLDTTVEVQDYFDQNVTNVFLSTLKTKKQDINGFKDLLESENYELMNYIDDRISGLTGDSLKLEVNEILREFYNSLILYQFKLDDNINNRLKNKYFELFISALPQIILDVDNTGSYKILYNFKPYHSEIVTQSFTRLKSESNLNKIVPNDSIYEILLKLIKADYASILVDYNNFLIEFSRQNFISLLENKNFNFEFDNLDKFLLNEFFVNKIEQVNSSLLQISSFLSLSFSEIFYNPFIVNEKFNFDFLNKNFSTYNIEEDFPNFLLYKKLTHNVLGEYQNFFQGINYYNNNESINIYDSFEIFV